LKFAYCLALKKDPMACEDMRTEEDSTKVEEVGTIEDVQGDQEAPAGQDEVPVHE
jgi:hypothetical protein